MLTSLQSGSCGIDFQLHGVLSLPLNFHISRPEKPNMTELIRAQTPVLSTELSFDQARMLNYWRSYSMFDYLKKKKRFDA